MAAEKIKYIFSDIDGVLTDGTVSISTSGQEQKRICYRDLDAIGIGRKAGLEFAFITGEDTELARRIAERFNISRVIYGAKDKGVAVKAIMEEMRISAGEICYVGDSFRDIPAIRLAGFGAAPPDAPASVRRCADIVTKASGGHGVLLELVEMILSKKEGKGEVTE